MSPAPNKAYATLIKPALCVEFATYLLEGTRLT